MRIELLGSDRLKVSLLGQEEKKRTWKHLLKDALTLMWYLVDKLKLNRWKFKNWY